MDFISLIIGITMLEELQKEIKHCLDFPVKFIIPIT